MTYRELLRKLANMSDQRLDQEVIIFDDDNDGCILRLICLGSDYAPERITQENCPDADALVISD